ncbi:membrane hypothetical protein [Azospirillaceae bacterium]
MVTLRRWKAVILLAASLSWVAVVPAQAVVAGSSQTDVRVIDDAAANRIAVEPMSDAAAQGAGCLIAATSSIGAVYAAGPTETMMLATGAVIVPSTSSLLFLALFGIVAAGTCGMGAVATPAVLWAYDQSEGLGARLAAAWDGLLGTVSAPFMTASAAHDDSAATGALPDLRAMTEPELQGTGCLASIAGSTSLAMATAPSEIVMLAAGGVTVASTTPILMLGLLATLIPASCGIGAFATLPVLALINSFDSGDSAQQALKPVPSGRTVVQSNERYTSSLDLASFTAQPTLFTGPSQVAAATGE